MQGNKKETIYCKRCILPDRYPEVNIDEQGICNFCLAHSDRAVLEEGALAGLVNSLKKGSRYDCVVPISGGKDSSFILYYAVKKLNLKAVAVNYDSGMQSDLAIENMKNTCRILNVPLVFKKADRRLQMKRLEIMLKLSERLGSFVLGCGGCVPVLQAVTIGFANDNDVPIILDGGSSLEHVPVLRNKIKKSKLKSIVKKLRNRVEPILRYRLYDLDFVKYRYLFKYRNCNKQLNEHMGVSKTVRPPLGYAGPFASKNTTIIRFSNYIMLPEEEIVRVIKEELDWKNPTGTDKRFDCLLHCLSDFDHLMKYGITSNGMVYSNIIRQGLMSREEALYKESYAKDNVSRDCALLAKKLKLDNYKIPPL
ncbi:MAG: hypothetical protein KKD11_05725 [Candidatus Omnitrophica bacterium]|nr:hypothetical protein [Candidatus Omnitrophota bacterium]